MPDAETRIRLQALEEDVSMVLRELGGVTPNGPTKTVRVRLHTLEGTEAAADAARAALAAITATKVAQTSMRERRFYAVIALAITVGNVVLAHLLK